MLQNGQTGGKEKSGSHTAGEKAGEKPGAEKGFSRQREPVAAQHNKAGRGIVKAVEAEKKHPQRKKGRHTSWVFLYGKQSQHKKGHIVNKHKLSVGVKKAGSRQKKDTSKESVKFGQTLSFKPEKKRSTEVRYPIREQAIRI